MRHDTSWRYSVPATLLLLSPFDLLASLGMDMYLPVVPTMATALAASPGTIQLTLTIYLVLIGAGQILFGPLSDRWGRRPVLLGGGLLYAGASLALALTSSANLFLLCRIIQACGASACLVATFATVRDIYAGTERSHVIYGMLGSLLAIVPAVGPLLGTLVDMWLGWRAIFALLGVTMAAMTLVAWWRWPETRRHHSSPASWGHLLHPLRRLTFWQYTLAYSAGMGSFFVFFSTAPWLLMTRHGLSGIHFSLLFATVAVAMMMAARGVGYLAPRWARERLLRTGMYCLMASALLLAASEHLIPMSVAGLMVPMWLAGVGIAMAISVAPNGALQGFDHIAGTVTAVYFCLGGLLLGGVGTVFLMLLPNATHWPVVGYSLLMATLVLCLSYINPDHG